jgi:hypothetical protein
VIWLDRLFLVRRILSDMQAAVARLEWSQTEVLTKLREIKTMPTVVARPGDRMAAIAELWQIRDLLSESDPDEAAQLMAVYNRLVTKGSGPGPDAA